MQKFNCQNKFGFLKTLYNVTMDCILFRELLILITVVFPIQNSQCMWHGLYF
jgi:hypothetical protein